MNKDDYNEIRNIVEDAVSDASQSSEIQDILSRLDEIFDRFDRQDSDIVGAFQWLGDKVDKLGKSNDS